MITYNILTQNITFVNGMLMSIFKIAYGFWLMS